MTKNFNRKALTIVCALLLSMSVLIALFLVDFNKSPVLAESDLIFTFVETSDDECSVRLKDKTVTRAIVPKTAEIDGKTYTVTSVAQNGFASARSLTKVRLPDTVTSIGASAFTNCSMLNSITLPKVQTIGANAFLRNTALQRIILPISLTSVGKNILRYNDTKVYVRAQEQSDGWDADWNVGNANQDVEFNSDFTPEIVYERVKVVTPQGASLFSENELTDGYIVSDYQEFTEVRDEEINIIIPNEYEGEPVVGLADYAFYDNNFTNLIIRYSDRSINLGEGCLSGLNGVNVIINRNVMFFNDYNEVSPSIFVDSTFQSVFLPDTVTQIVPFMFSGCVNLTDIWFIHPEKFETENDIGEYTILSDFTSTGVVTLPDAVEEIGDEAFSGISGIQEIRIGSNVKTMGENVFVDWGDKGNEQRVYIDYYSESDLPDGWSPNWKRSTRDSFIVIYNGEYTITYVLNGGTHEGNTDSYMSHDSIKLNDAYKTGSFFDGWYFNEDFSGDKVEEIKRGTSGNLTLYAKFTSIEYQIHYEPHKPLQASGEVYGTMVNSTHKYGEESSLSKNGYSLAGWSFTHWTDSFGVKHSDEELIRFYPEKSGVTIYMYAEWKANIYEITFDFQGGTGGTTKANATFDADELPTATAPAKLGSTFDGYYAQPDGQGKKYYDSGMRTVNKWDIASNDVLYANWKKIPYTVTLDKQDGKNGIDYVSPAYYQETLPEASIPVMDGHDFCGYYAEPKGKGKQYYDTKMKPSQLDVARDITVYAHWKLSIYTVKFEKEGGVGGDDDVIVTYSKDMPAATAPKRTGYTFMGYYAQSNGVGTQYYDKNMNSVHTWDIDKRDVEIYANWQANTYSIGLIQTLNGQEIAEDRVSVTFGEPLPERIKKVTLKDYYTLGFYYGDESVENLIYTSDGYFINDNSAVGEIYLFDHSIYLYCYWYIENYYFVIDKMHYKDTKATVIEEVVLSYIDGYVRMADDEFKGAEFERWSMRLNGPPDDVKELEESPWYVVTESYWLEFDVKDVLQYYPNYVPTDKIYFRAVYGSFLDDVEGGGGSCVAEGTLITLADGSQKPVEQLAGDDMLLVWNLYTGSFDVAPIFFIDSDPLMTYKVINLYFSDGTTLKVISEHALWDCKLNKYVYLREDAAMYIGHTFKKQSVDLSGNLGLINVQLTDVVVCYEYTSAWSPVTYGHLCYYVNGMLSMPGGIDGLFNIFEVDGDSMKYDVQSMEQDILTYGSYTYEELCELVPIPQKVFEAISAQYLKVAVGKGLITIERLNELAERYSVFF